MIRILIVDDHHLFRQSLRTIIGRQQDMTVVGEAANGFEALKQAKCHQPDIILMDVGMPGMDGIDATRRIRELPDDVKIIGLSSHSGDIYKETMIAAGADDYLPKICDLAKLLDCIRAVWANRS